MNRNYRCVNFANLSMSSLGVFSDEWSMFLDMMNDAGIDKKQQLYITKKMINIAIRAVYYIFCCRNRNWDSSDFMQCWFFFSFFFLSFFFLFCFVFFLIIQSQAAFCKLPIRSEFYNCAFKNTNKVSITIISIHTKIVFIIVGPDLPLMLQQPISFKTWGWGFSLFITFSSVITSCLSLELALASYEKENYNYMTKQHLNYYYHYFCCCFVITVTSIPTKGFSYTFAQKRVVL